MKLEHSFTVPADLDTVWQAVLDPERVAPCMPGATLSEVTGDTFKGTVKVKLGPISLLYKGSGEFLEKDDAARTVVIKASGKDSRGNGTASATVTVTLKESGSETVGAVNTDLSITGKPAQFGRGLISEVGGKILDTFATCLAAKLAPATETSPETSGTANNHAPTEAAQPEEPPTTESPDTTAEPAAAEEASAAESQPKLSLVDTTAPEEGTAVSAAESDARATGKHAGETAAAHAPAATKPKLALATEPESEPIDLLAYAGPSVLKRAAPLLVLLAAVVTFIALRRRR